MATIPIYQESVGTEGASTPTPHLPGMPESASGVNLAEAAARLGSTVEHGAEQLGHVLAYKAHLESQERAYDLSSKAAGEIQDKLNGQDGYLTRQGSNAHGITAGFVGPTQEGQKEPVKYEDSFDGFSNKLRDKYLQQAGGEYERKLLTRTLDAHITVARNAVLKHEAEQGKIAYADSIENHVHALMDTGASASNPEDLAHVMDEGDKLRVGLAHFHGTDDPNTVEAVRKKTADEFAETAVKANLERDPARANTLYEGVKDKLSEVGRGKIQAVIDGKMLELRTGAIWNQVKDFRHPDGKVDYEKAMGEATKYVERPDVPPGERQHILNEIKQHIGVADRELQDTREAQNRAFKNDALTMREQGKTLDEATDALFKRKGYGFDSLDIDQKRMELYKLYTEDDRTKFLPADTQIAIQEGIAASDGYFKKTQKVTPEGSSLSYSAKELFDKTLKEKAIKGRWNADQVRTYVHDTLQKIPAGDQRILRSVIPGGVPWGHKEEALQVELEQHSDMTIRSKVGQRIASELGRPATQSEIDKVITSVYGRTPNR